MSKCSICKKTFEDSNYKPFCSKRCADVDLGNWFNGKYAFEAVELDENEIEELSSAIFSDGDSTVN